MFSKLKDDSSISFLASCEWRTTLILILVNIVESKVIFLNITLNIKRLRGVEGGGVSLVNDRDKYTYPNLYKYFACLFVSNKRQNG